MHLAALWPTLFWVWTAAEVALLIFLAIGLHSAKVPCLAIMLVCPAAALLLRIHVEEQALRRASGPGYTSYQQATERLTPGIYSTALDTRWAT